MNLANLFESHLAKTIGSFYISPLTAHKAILMRLL